MIIKLTERICLRIVLYGEASMGDAGNSIASRFGKDRTVTEYGFILLFLQYI